MLQAVSFVRLIDRSFVDRAARDATERLRDRRHCNDEPAVLGLTPVGRLHKKSTGNVEACWEACWKR